MISGVDDINGIADEVDSENDDDYNDSNNRDRSKNNNRNHQLIGNNKDSKDVEATIV